jgi:hypothetical protein
MAGVIGDIYLTSSGKPAIGDEFVGNKLQIDAAGLYFFQWSLLDLKVPLGRLLERSLANGLDAFFDGREGLCGIGRGSAAS